MVQRLINYFHKEFGSLHQAALLLGAAGIGADILALARDRLFASIFGAGRELDLYFAAFRVPDLIYTLTLLFAANTAIIPILLKRIETDEEGAQRFFGGLMVIFLVFTVVLSAVAFIAMPYLIPFIAPGFIETDAASVVLLARIMLLSPILLGLSNLVSSIVQSYRRFFVYALSPIFYNIGIIAGILIFYPVLGIAGLGWGVALGAALHLLIQLPSVVRLGFVPHLRFQGLRADILAVMKLSLPRTAGLSLNQLTTTAVTALASLFAAGSIAVFNFAQNLQSVPLSVVGLSYSVAAFPTLARLFVANRREEFIASVAMAMRHIILWSIPISVLFIVLRAQIVRVVLGSGAFSWADTRLTAAAFLLFSLSILSQSIVMLFVRALYAAGRTTLPLLINLFASAITVLLALLFVNLSSGGRVYELFLNILRVADVSGAAMLVLPLAVSLGSILNALALVAGFNMIFGVNIFKNYWRALLEIAAASALCGALTYLALRVFAGVFDLETFVGVFAQGLFAGGLGIAALVAVLRTLRNAEFMEIWEALHERFWHAEVLASEPESIK
ncbi:MAG: murein biosynthesis integral membrane protein MurJ [Candidatus Niyogibacteria bacterium]|nr:murein biosynthesis integral membrane protein MurJ [Candidatus Niyogibacteria bacterium]